MIEDVGKEGKFEDLNIDSNDIGGLPKLSDNDINDIGGLPKLSGNNDTEDLPKLSDPEEKFTITPNIQYTSGDAEKHASTWTDKPPVTRGEEHFFKSPDMGLEESQKRKRKERSYKKKEKKREHNKKNMMENVRAFNREDIYELMTDLNLKQPGRVSIANDRPRKKGRFIKKSGKGKLTKGKLTKGKLTKGKLTKAQKKQRDKKRTKAKRDLIKAKKTLKKALAKYNKAMKT